MAKDKTAGYIVNFNAEIKALKQNVPGRLYALWGPEEYLRERFIEKLISACLPEGDTGFSMIKFNPDDFDMVAFKQAVDSVPFMSERTYVELRDIDYNRFTEPEGNEFSDIIADIPEYCSVCIVNSSPFEPDIKKKAFQTLDKFGKLLRFDPQSQGALADWINRRFAALGKSIDLESAQRLMFISGDTMSRLLPEIEKLASYEKGNKITFDDVNKIANHIPEARVFEIISALEEKNYNIACRILAELLSDKENEPVMIIALLSAQFRKLYYISLAAKKGKKSSDVASVLKLSDYSAKQLFRAASTASDIYFKDAVRICADAEYRMKSSGGDGQDILKTAFGEIINSGHKDEARRKGNYSR